tara:strand:+ start:109 stop:1095 length:987 start_codon:yes stop_codon:yes gene_type:complete
MMPNAEIHCNPLVKNRESDPDINEPCRRSREPFVDKDFLNHNYDIAFVDSTYEGDTDRVKYDTLFLFDSADKPLYPLGVKTEGRAYYDLRDKAKCYAKFSYDSSENHSDGLKRIAFPITPYLVLNEISKVKTIDWVNHNSIPHLYGAPTYGHNYKSLSNTRFTSTHEDGDIMFNQRYKWFSELEEYNIPFDGGLVFTEDECISRDYQEKHFPGISRFSKNREAYNQSISKLLFHHRVGLCPTGLERNSWRLFDLMATGAIIYRTDTDIRFLYEPKHQWVVKDDDHLGDIYLRDIKDFREMHKASQENRKVLASLTPDKIWKDFINQIN